MIGTTNARDTHTPFGIKQSDRLHHMYVIGQTGTGKSTLVKNLAIQDIQAGRGCMVIDPHGDMVKALFEVFRGSQEERIIYFDVTHPQLKWGYNPLTHVSTKHYSLLTSGVLEIFKKLWPTEWGVRMEHLFRHAVLTLLEQPNANLGDILALLRDKEYRKECIKTLSNQEVKDFWEHEFEKYSPRLKVESSIPITNKLSGFLSNPTINRIVCGAPNNIRLRSVMDERKVLLVNLAKGQIGEDATNLLGSLLLTSVGLAGYSRSSIPEHQRIPFYTHIDEAHNFLTLSSASMLSELRKYGVSLSFVGQYLRQNDIEIRDAILGNVGTLLSFRVGPTDAVVLEKEFKHRFSQSDFMSLANYDLYLKMMIDGAPSRPFSATTKADIQ